MAIIDDEEEVVETILFEPSKKAGEEANFKTHDDLGMSLISNKESKLKDVIQYVGGYKWKGNYYNNLANTNDSIKAHSVQLDPSVQKYNKIESMVIFLDNTLDVETNIQDMKLNGTINAGIIPFIGDMFITNMVGGRTAIFSIVNVETKTFQMHKIYDVELSFFQFLDNYTREFEDLESKVVNHYYYDTRFVLDYGSPILLKEEYKDKLDFGNYKKKLLDIYLNLFLDKDNSMINVFSTPFTKEGIQYECGRNYLDPYLIRFFRKTTNVEDNYKLMNISYPIEDESYDFNNETILDSLLNKGTVEDMMFITNNMYWKNLELSESNPTLRHISYLNIDKVMCPVEEGTQVELSTGEREYLFKREEKEGLVYPLHYKKDEETSYIFSGAFYIGNIDAMTKFEILIYNYMNFGNLSLNDLKPYIRSVTQWSRYEQFYIIPIIMHLITVLTQETHSNR